MNEITKLVAKIKALQDKAQIIHKQLAAQLVLRELLHLSADADVVVSGKWVLVQAEAQFEVTVSPTEPDTRGGPCFGTETHVFQYDDIPQALGGGLVERTYDGEVPEAYADEK